MVKSSGFQGRVARLVAAVVYAGVFFYVVAGVFAADLEVDRYLVLMLLAVGVVAMVGREVWRFFKWVLNG